MIYTSHSGRFSSGKFTEGSKFIRDYQQKVSAILGKDVSVYGGIGEFGRVMTSIQYENMADLEATMEKAMQSDEYRGLLDAAEGLFEPGTTETNIWKSLD